MPTGAWHTKQRSELGQQAHLHHLAAEACVEGEVEEETKSDIQQILMITRDQLSQLLHSVRFSLGYTQRQHNTQINSKWVVR